MGRSSVLAIACLLFAVFGGCLAENPSKADEAWKRSADLAPRPQGGAQRMPTTVLEIPASQVGQSGNEPFILAAPDGTIYVSALQFLYRSTNGGATFQPLPRPPFASINLGSDSGLALDPGGRLYFTFDWPYAGSTAVCTSDNRGDAWSCNPEAIPGVTDRMWITAPSNAAAYVVSNLGLYQTSLFASHDRGLTWAPLATTARLLAPQTGPLAADPLDAARLIQPIDGGNIAVNEYLATSAVPLAGSTLTGLTSHSGLPSAAFTSDGTAFVVSERTANGVRQVELARKPPGALQWSRFKIPASGFGSAAFSYVIAKELGHVGVIYYATSAAGDPSVLDAADWSVVFAESFDANAPAPTWNVTTIDPLAHHGAICAGATCSQGHPGARFAGDFISASFGLNQAHLSWVNDAAGGLKIQYLGR